MLVGIDSQKVLDVCFSFPPLDIRSRLFLRLFHIITVMMLRYIASFVRNNFCESMAGDLYLSRPFLSILPSPFPFSAQQ